METTRSNVELVLKNFATGKVSIIDRSHEGMHPDALRFLADARNVSERRTHSNVKWTLRR